MGIFTDFYVVDPAEVHELFSWVSPPPVGEMPVFEDDPEGFGDLFEEWREQQPLAEPSPKQQDRLSALELLAYKGVLPGLVSTLEHLLRGTPIDVAGHMLLAAPSFSHTLYEVSPALVKALATLPEAELAPLARRWGRHEEVRWSEEDARELVRRFAELARSAAAKGRGVYLLVSGV